MISKLIITLLIAALLLLCGCRRNQSSELVNVIEYQTDEIDNIQLDYDADNIYLLPTEDDKIILKEFMNENNKKYYGKVRHRDTELFITEGKRPLRTSFESYLELHIPTQYEGSLALHSTSGIIKADSSFAFRGSFHADTTSSPIELSQIEATDITLTTTSGQINVGELSANTIHIDTTSADTSATKLHGTITYESKSGSLFAAEVSGGGDFSASGDGSIEAGFKKLTDNLSCYAKNGTVKITLPRQAAFTFTAQTKNGHIRTDFEDRLTEREGILSGTIGGDSTAVSIETRNGDIDVSMP